MCLIVFAWRPEHGQPLIVAANRDEFYTRPTQALGRWPETQVHAGRDLEAGGTWLGVGANGRFAALTNIRRPGQLIGSRSRGELVAQFLAGEMSAEGYAAEVSQRSAEYTGFNLLLRDGQRLAYVSSATPDPVWLPAGVYGLSNAGLDTAWPKLTKTRSAMAAGLDDYSIPGLLELLADARPAPTAELPDTGVGQATETLLSSVFIASPNYGTRASTVVVMGEDGTAQMVERSFGVNGVPIGEVRLVTP